MNSEGHVSWNIIEVIIIISLVSIFRTFSLGSYVHVHSSSDLFVGFECKLPMELNCQHDRQGEKQRYVYTFPLKIKCLWLKFIWKHLALNDLSLAEIKYASSSENRNEMTKIDETSCPKWFDYCRALELYFGAKQPSVWWC